MPAKNHSRYILIKADAPRARWTHVPASAGSASQWEVPHKDSLCADEWPIVLDKESYEIVYDAIVHKESAFPFEFVKTQIIEGWKWMKASKNRDQQWENSSYRSPACLTMPSSTKNRLFRSKS